jgi:hypothetical protein
MQTGAGMSRIVILAIVIAFVLLGVFAALFVGGRDGGGVDRQSIMMFMVGAIVVIGLAAVIAAKR